MVHLRPEKDDDRKEAVRGRCHAKEGVVAELEKAPWEEVEDHQRLQAPTAS